MNNTPLLNEADPQEVAAALKEALRERNVAMEALREERDAYRKALEEIRDRQRTCYGSPFDIKLRQHLTPTGLIAADVLDKYPPIKDNTNG